MFEYLSFVSCPEKWFVLQLVVWGLRGVARVILANNPLSGALILAALYWASPWQGLLGSLGVLASTLTAVIIGQDRWSLHCCRDPNSHKNSKWWFENCCEKSVVCVNIFGKVHWIMSECSFKFTRLILKLYYNVCLPLWNMLMPILVLWLKKNTSHLEVKVFRNEMQDPFTLKLLLIKTGKFVLWGSIKSWP